MTQPLLIRIPDTLLQMVYLQEEMAGNSPYLYGHLKLLSDNHPQLGNLDG